MKWPFRRKQSVLPSEVEDYYKAEKRERTGIAWLLAFGTLVITVALALGVFFGARWAYRRIAGTDQRPTPTQTEEARPAQSQPTAPPSVTSESPSGNVTVEPTPQPTPSAPSTGSTGEQIPNTGPSESLAVFIIVSTLGVFAHRLYTLRRLG